jgi:hypothetical protein
MIFFPPGDQPEEKAPNKAKVRRVCSDHRNRVWGEGGPAQSGGKVRFSPLAKGLFEMRGAHRELCSLGKIAQIVDLGE